MRCFPSVTPSHACTHAGVGAGDLLHRSCVGLHQRLTLLVDGVEVPIPSDAEGLVILNIGCHMGGVWLWETGVPPPASPPPSSAGSSAAASAFGSAGGGGGGAAGAAGVGSPTLAGLTCERRAALNDEVLEVVAIGGVLHMGRLAVGLSRGQRVCQGSSVTVITKETLPMQVRALKVFQCC